MTETTIIYFLIAILVICIILCWMLHIIWNELKSIQVDLMCIETRQKSIILEQEKMQMTIDFATALLESIEEALPDENKEK